MKKSRLLLIIFCLALVLSGCSSAVKSIDLRLSGQKITPVFLPDSSLLAENMAEETTTVSEVTTPLFETPSAPPVQTVGTPEGTDPEETLPSGSEPAETSPEDTLPPQTDPPETDPPVTRAPQTDPPVTSPQTTAPRTTAPTTVSDAHTADNVQRIEILTLPDKTVYDQYHEPISAKGLTLLAYWEDGYQKVVTEGFTIYDVNGNTAPVTSEEGEYTIFVRYGSQTAYFTVTFILSENVPLEIDGSFSSARKFYEGEYVKHLCLGAWLGGDYIPGEELIFSQERLDRPGLITVTVSWNGHKAERTFAVLPRDQYELTMEDLQWLSCCDDCGTAYGMTLTAAWFYERLLPNYPSIVSQRPLPSDVIPEEEFIFTPAVVTYSGVQLVTVTCRGLTHEFWIGLY